MAVISGDLKVTIKESITLPNKNEEVCTNTVTISDVGQITRRTDTITTGFRNKGVEIIKFTDSEEEQTAGSFVRDTVKYMRFTNLDSTNFLTLYLIQTEAISDEEALFKIDPGKSVVFSNGQFDGSGISDYVAGGYVDPQYFVSGDFASLSLIKAKADTSNVQMEYLVASS